MEKLPMCRICLVKNVRMVIVANRNLHKLYEKLTDIPFVTEDRRPMLACFFCCAKLKQCYRLLKQCLAAEELFAQKLTDYEPNSLTNQDHLKISGGFIISAIENINIVDVVQTDGIAIKEEFPDVCESLDNIIEPKEEHQSDGDPTTWSPENEMKDENPKMCPIFKKPDPGIAVPGNTKGVTKRSRKRSLIKTTYMTNSGQKKFGATQCAECGDIYKIGDPQDEHDHNLVHHNVKDVLQFNGFRGEYVVDRSGSSRCIRVRGGETGWKKVEQLLDRVVHPHLGYSSSLPKGRIHTYTAYLYVEKRQIMGCLIVERKQRAYKLIPGEPDSCSEEDYPVKCGVSRIWTHVKHRRRGIATRLLGCARASFLYGVALRVSDIAFSVPTAAGKAFATKYCETPNFYVHLS